MESHRGPVRWRTAIVSVLVLLCGYSAAAWSTRDFQVWIERVADPAESAVVIEDGQVAES